MVPAGARSVNDGPRGPRFREGGPGTSTGVKTIIAIVYVVIGVVVASTHHYLAHLGDIKAIASAVLAILLWPLVLFGVNLHLGHVGRAHR